jgi:mono/diheme cytochrome c family protein
MPATPAGVVPVDLESPLPTADDASRLRNPLPATKENIARGKVYYNYYCVFCHGEQGDGAGPVGEAYVPVPADLRSRKILAYSDGQMLRAMLLGEGHAPVLQRTVYPEHRWYLVLYVRQFDWAAPATQ